LQLYGADDGMNPANSNLLEKLLKTACLSYLRTAVFATVGAAAIPALAANAVVNGDANPNLAGRDPGYTCCNGDSAPAQSPTLVTGLTLNAGDTLTFAAQGEVSYTGNAGSGNNPDGTVYAGIPYTYGDGIAAPTNLNRIDALVGVFLGASSPTGGSTPTSLDFSGGLAFTSLSPLIGQTFFIGNGLTGDTNLADYGGTVQSFIVPTGATRLYLGTTDGFGWYNNNGTFQVDTTSVAQAVPKPETYALMLAGLFAAGAGARRRKGATV
jgi:hypothetical protein